MAEWTQEEREKASSQLTPNTTMTDLQCSVTALREALSNMLQFVNRGTEGYWKPSYAKAIAQADEMLAKTAPPQ